MSILGLPAINARGANCESLSSYLIRSAWALGISPGQLVHRVLAWAGEHRPALFGSWRRRPRVYLIGRNINCHSHGATWLRVLQEAAGSSELKFLTSLDWDACFPSRGFQRSTLAWCPICLRDDKIPYHRLTWMIQAYRTCTTHRISLVERCAQCQRSVPVTHERSSIVKCPYCGGFLIASLHESLSIAEGSYELWASRQVEGLHLLANRAEFEFKWNAPAAIGALIRARGPGVPAVFAKTIGAPKTTVWAWLSGASAPTLPNALHVYYVMGVDLCKYLEGRSFDDCRMGGEIQRRIWLRSRSQPQFRDWLFVEGKLRKYLVRRKFPLSLSAVGRMLDIAPRTLRGHFPSICKQISQNYLRFGYGRKQRRIRKLESLIAHSIGQLRASGNPITARAIAAACGDMALFRNHEARDILRRVVEPEGRNHSSSIGAKA
jgi:predicted RNA-binding Zn-ribbon protein involved in translation (DUF1610 family)